MPSDKLRRLLPESDPAPAEVRMAIRVLLNHIEPGAHWENCRAIVLAWLDGKVEVPDAE